MSKILVVDDSASVRQQVSDALRSAGFSVAEATDGAEGLAVIQRELKNITAVICDINMPRMNGLEMLESVMRDPQNHSLPVIMLTSEVQASLVERAKKAGAKGWIVKPFKADLLIAAVKKVSKARAA